MRHFVFPQIRSRSSPLIFGWLVGISCASGCHNGKIYFISSYDSMKKYFLSIALMQHFGNERFSASTRMIVDFLVFGWILLFKNVLKISVWKALNNVASSFRVWHQFSWSLNLFADLAKFIFHVEPSFGCWNRWNQFWDYLRWASKLMCFNCTFFWNGKTFGHQCLVGTKFDILIKWK